MVHFTRACKTLLSENNKTRLTFEKQQEKNKNIICRPWSVRIEKNCALGLEHGPRPAASGRTQDLWHSFSQYGPPGWQIIYISLTAVQIYEFHILMFKILQPSKKCTGKNDLTNPRENENTFLVPWYFVASVFHCIIPWVSFILRRTVKL